MLNILFGNSELDFGWRIIVFIVLALALMLSITLHEVAHGLVAHWNGDDTAKVNGRLSLNPLKHFDPIGAIMLLFVGFGYAKPVPVNPYNFKHYRKGCILVSIAGVTTNLIISFISSGLYVLMNVLYIKSNGAIGLLMLSLFFFYLSFYNIVLCFFNLLPLFPLDGFNLIDALCRRKNSVIRFLRNYGQYILIAFVIVDVIVSRLNVPFYFSPLDVYFTYTAQLVHTGFTRLWTLILGGI